MKIRIRLFAAFREAAGRGDVWLDVPAGSDVAGAVAQLRQEYPRLNDTAQRALFAVNREYVPPDHPLADGDELALIPPVSGG